MPVAILLCGPSGSGKSTLTRTLLSDFNILNTDHYINRWAKNDGLTYRDVYDKYYEAAEKEYMLDIESHQVDDMSFVLDRTHLNEQSRKKALRQIDDRYTKVAVYFPSFTLPVLRARVDARAAMGEHYVNDDVIQGQLNRYQIPKEVEGFDFVVSASYLEKILKHFDWKNIA